MPLYRYKCPQCEHEFTVLKDIDDEDIVPCPECGEFEVERVIGVTGFQLKGGGWFADGYSSDR